MDIKQGIVRIESGSKVGTGFLIDQKGHVLTAAHNLQLEAFDFYCVFPSETGSFSDSNRLRGTPVHYFKEGDIAILKIQSPMPSHALPMLLVAPEGSENHQVQTHGFTKANQKNGEPGTGRVSKIFETDKGVPNFQIRNANEISAGFSGAPVFDPQKRGVIGMLTDISIPDRDLRGTELAYAIPISFIAELVSSVPEPALKFQIHSGEKDYPRGFAPIRLQKKARPSGEIRFQDYQYEQYIRYVSRDEFKSLPGNQSLDLLTESDILTEFLDKEKYLGCIISGVGGIGKTRMMRELGLKAVEKDWEVITVKSFVDSLEPLFPVLDRGKKYLLVYDYLEENTSFNVEWLEDYLESGAGKFQTIKLLANCRSTFKYHSGKYPGENPSVLDTEIYDDKEGEKLYRRAVANNILESIEGHQKVKDHLRAFGEITPAFAVFVKYLIQVDGESTEIVGFKDFSSWIKRRLAMTLRKGTESLGSIPRDLVYLIPLFPMSESQVDRFEKEHPFYYSRLLRDKWVEQNLDDQLIVVHDTLADEILQLHLKENKSLDFDRFIRLSFTMACEWGAVESWLRSFERIQGQGHIKHFNTKIALRLAKVLNEMEPGDLQTCYDLVSSPLFTSLGIVNMLQSSGAYFEEFLASKLTAFPLSVVAYQLAKELKNLEENPPTTDPENQIQDFMKGWFHTFFNAQKTWINSHLSGRLVSSYIKLFELDDFAQTKTRTILAQKHLSKSQGFLISAWLDAKGDVSEVEKPMLAFLKSYGTSLEASFVLNSWINAGGDAQLVIAHIQRFLEAQGANLQIRFLLKSWLDMGGDTAMVRENTVEFLRHFSTNLEATFILSGWLEAGGEPELVQEFVVQYLQVNSDKAEARFAIKSWLDAKGDLEVIKPFVKNFLNHIGTKEEAPFVLKPWLDAGGAHDLVKQPIIEYLDSHSESPEIRFVLTGWLDAGGSLETIEKYIINYFGLHAKSLDANFVYSAWLEAGGSHEFIRDFIAAYLEANRLNEETQYVFKAWLDTGGEKTLIESQLLEFLMVRYDTEGSNYLFKSWLLKTSDTEFIFDQLVEHLKLFSTHIDSQFLYKAWLDAGGDRTVVEPFIQEYLEAHSTSTEAPFVLKAWLDAGGAPSLIETPLVEYLSAHETNEKTNFVLTAWLDSGGAHALVQQQMVKFLEANVDSEYSNYVIYAWLDSEGDASVIETAVVEYLKRFGTEDGANFILTAWLEAGGAPHSVTSFLIDQLETKHLDEKKSFAIKAWLDAGGGREEVQKPVLEYLGLYEESVEAAYVYTAWLGNGGSPSFVEEHLLKYLNVHKKRTETSYIYKAWLNAGGAWNTVFSSIEEWMTLHISERPLSCLYIIPYWIKYRGLDSQGYAWFEKLLFHFRKDFSNTKLLIQFLHDNVPSPFVLSRILLKLGVGHALVKDMLDMGLGTHGPVVIQLYATAWLGVHISSQKGDEFEEIWRSSRGKLAMLRESTSTWLEEQPNSKMWTKFKRLWIRKLFPALEKHVKQRKK